MNRFKFFAAVFSLTILVILVSVILLLRKIGTSSLPQEDGTSAVPGLGVEVKISRDSLGVPYIQAESDSDAYFALGYVHAQDRLFQMEMYRRLGEGRLSEIFGSKTVPIDELFRTLRFREMADSIYDNSSPLSKNILRWYSNGINAYISTAKVLPAEFAMLQFSPSPWKPQDSYIVARLMAWELNISWWTKPVFGELYDRLGADKASILIPLFGDSRGSSAPKGRGRGAAALNGFIEANSKALAFLEGARSPDCFGSNNWTIAPARSSTGSAILCNDPHLAFSEPAKWYLVSISSPSLHVIGVSLPGAPGVVIGRNRNVAWGMTNVMADDADFYIMKPDSGNPDRYWYNNKSVPFTSTLDTIEVKGESPTIFSARTSIPGPIVSGVMADSYQMSSTHSSVGNSDQVVAMKWSAYSPSDEVRAIYLMNTSKDFSEFVGALKYFGAPAQNFVYADTKGNIGYKAAGNIPLRNYPLPFLPQSGTSSKAVWQGFIPFESLPESFNPQDGFIATANNRTAPENYPYYLTNLYEPSSRIDRIKSFLSQHDTMSVELCRELQLDYYSDFMVNLNGKVLAACDSEIYSPKELVYLRNFNGIIDAKSTAASILNLTFVEMVKRTFEPLMGESLYKKYILISNVPTRVLEGILSDPAKLGELYGVANGDSLLNLQLTASLDASLRKLRTEFGSRPINWMWGKIHTLELKHPLSSNRIIRDVYDLGPFPRGGTNTTVNNGEFSLDDPYQMLIGPSMRMIVDMSKDGLYFSLPGGECGQLLSNHYSDFLKDYLDGRVSYFPLSASGRTHQLSLVPAH